MVTFFIIAGTLVVCGGLIVYDEYFSESGKLRRMLRGARQVSIAAFPDGGVGKIVGRLEYLQEPMSTPLNVRPCAYYDIVIERKYYRVWKQVIREVGGHPFAVRDDTGVAIVEPDRALVLIVHDRHTHSGALSDATPFQEEFLARHGYKSRGRLFNKNLRYVEGILEEGEEVVVFGVGQLEPDPDAAADGRGYRDSAPMRLRMSGSARKPLLISDDRTTVARRALPAPSTAPRE